MTDPELADRTYIEPITLDVIEQVIQRERPDALLPTMGGQTALNAAVGLAEQGILKKYGVQLIGASYEAIRKAEDREAFKHSMMKIGLRTPDSIIVRNRIDAPYVIEKIGGGPPINRPSLTPAGPGGHIACKHGKVER